MNRKPVILKLPCLKQGRTIVISDIHGNLHALKQLLVECNYKPSTDRLILAGDLLEKGTENLATLHCIMKLCQKYSVYALMGNCDFTVKNAFLSYRLDFLKQILLTRKNSVLHEMAQSIGIVFDKNIDMEQYCFALRKSFYNEMAFINDLPHIIETPDMIITHAGIQSNDDYGDDFKVPMTTPLFFETKQCFDKKVICGHMPVTEYQRHIASFDPIYDPKKNIYSIDGGNIVKKGGQLNALIFDQNHVYVKRYDDLTKAICIQSVDYQQQIPLFVTWNRGEIEILKRDKYQSYIYCFYLKRAFWVDNEFIEQRHGKWFASDYTNYQIPLKKGDVVKIVRQYRDKAQIKKDGILGWTYLKNLKILKS